MGTSEPGLTGAQQLAAISTTIAALQSEHYGRSSTQVDAYAVDDMVVVVLRVKALTPLEKTLLDAGEPETVVALRREFDRAMAARYRSAVEHVTGRNVVALLSQAREQSHFQLITVSSGTQSVASFPAR